jgi:hypothetical protein
VKQVAAAVVLIAVVPLLPVAQVIRPAVIMREKEEKSQKIRGRRLHLTSTIITTSQRKAVRLNIKI